MIENVVIGKPLVHPSEIFAYDKDDWENIEKEKTLFTEERSLARIMVQIGMAPSMSEIRRNRPKLMMTLDTPDYFFVKWGKKWLFVLVGE